MIEQSIQEQRKEEEEEEKKEKTELYVNVDP